MSLGETDALWWNRICNWLTKNNDHYVIIHNFIKLRRSVLPLDTLMEAQKKKKTLLNFSDLDNNTKESLYNRIYVTTDNIFSELNNVAEKESTFLQTANAHIPQEAV